MHINPDHFLETEAGRVTTPERNKTAWIKCFEALDVALEGATSDAKVFVMVGPQGAGKSSWVRSNLRANHNAIAFDAILVKRSERKPIIDAAKAHGVQVIAVWLKTPLAMCIARNAIRPSDEIVDERAIRNVHAAIEPPELDEGFAKVIEVG
jgi:predicted kinase